MVKVILHIYDYFYNHRPLCFTLLAAVTLLSVVSVFRMEFREDIGDFLPDEVSYRKSMEVYGKVAGADRIFVVFRLRDSSAVDGERLMTAVDSFAALSADRDWRVTARIDYDRILEGMDFVYDNAPLFLNDAQMRRIRAMMSPDSVALVVARLKERLLLPSGALSARYAARDPLGLFAPLLSEMQSQGAMADFELDDGYVFSPDGKWALVMVESPYGSSETSRNGMLVRGIRDVAAQVEQAMPDMELHITGAPAVAVDNATRIKQDSVLAVGIAVVLILALLLFTLRRVRYMALIVVSLAFGWLVAMAGLALIEREVSVIVLGIASIIIGIAVNYPLHFVSHLHHQPSVRETLREICPPLVTGNITTVGAFAALIPLDSVALRDLGLFASLMLVGTILFVVVFLPQLCGQPKSRAAEAAETGEGVEIEPVYPHSRWLKWGLVAATVVAAYYSFQTEFDTDMQHINYLTVEQWELLTGLGRLHHTGDGVRQVYVVAEGNTPEEALDAGNPDWMVSGPKGQERRAERWNAFVAEYGGFLREVLPREAVRNGFSPDAFSPFFETLDKTYVPLDFDAFRPMLEMNATQRVVGNKAVEVLNLPRAEADSVLQAYGQGGNRWAFDVQSMNSSVARSLSDNFNYIGWACGLIVFLFLWVSFRKLEHALIAFLPMVVSWLWILCLMHFCGMKFNLVNIILATFIFGQGDDYSIFITEGLIYEFEHRRRMLASFRRSIVISALIMFIGMGTLVVAKHPALFSLGQITIVGMFSVVVMACVLPPVIFGWLYTDRRGNRRAVPITLRRLFGVAYAAVIYLAQVFYGIVLGFILFVCLGRTRGRVAFYHRQMRSLFRFDIRHIMGVRTRIENPDGETFEKPCLIICNHQSILDSICLMALSSRIRIVTNRRVWHHPIIHRVLSFADFMTMEDGVGRVTEGCRQRVEEGCSVALFPEGQRVTAERIGRFHKGPFYLSRVLGLDIVPVYLYGLREIMPRGSVVYAQGRLTIEIGKRISRAELRQMGDDDREVCREVYRRYSDHYSNRQTEGVNAPNPG